MKQNTVERAVKTERDTKSRTKRSGQARWVSVTGHQPHHPHHMKVSLWGPMFACTRLCQWCVLAHWVFMQQKALHDISTIHCFHYGLKLHKEQRPDLLITWTNGSVELMHGKRQQLIIHQLGQSWVGVVWAWAFLGIRHHLEFNWADGGTLHLWLHIHNTEQAYATATQLCGRSNSWLPEQQYSWLTS